jgi:hypothetical protein
MPAKQTSEKAKSPRVFGHARKPAKILRAALYSRVSTNDQQTLPMQSLENAQRIIVANCRQCG